MKKFKGKFEYCHLLEDKIVITRTHEIEDLVTDYRKSINDFLKMLMVFIIAIPIFTALSVVMFCIGHPEVGIMGAAWALIFLSLVFFYILFTTGAPVIFRDKISSIKFKPVFNVIQIKFKEFGLTKRRNIDLSIGVSEKKIALQILKEEGLIKDIK